MRVYYEGVYYEGVLRGCIMRVYYTVYYNGVNFIMNVYFPYVYYEGVL